MILPCKMSAAGDFFRFQDATKVILPCKMSAAGDFFSFSRRYKGILLDLSVAPPLGRGEPRGEHFRLGGEQGGAHAEISTSENLSGSPPGWGGAKGGAFSVLGRQGGSPRRYLGKVN